MHSRNQALPVLVFALVTALTVLVPLVWESSQTIPLDDGGYVPETLDAASQACLLNTASPSSPDATWRQSFHIDRARADDMMLVFSGADGLTVAGAGGDAPLANSAGYQDIDTLPLAALPYDEAYGGYRLAWTMSSEEMFGFSAFLAPIPYVRALGSVTDTLVLLTAGCLAMLFLYCASLFAFKPSERYLLYFCLYIGSTLAWSLIRAGHLGFSLLPCFPAEMTAVFFVCIQTLSLFAMAQILLDEPLAGGRLIISVPAIVLLSFLYYVVVNLAGVVAAESIRLALLAGCAVPFLKGWADGRRGAWALCAGFATKLGLAALASAKSIGLLPFSLPLIFLDPLEFLDLTFFPACMFIINYYFAAKFREAEALARELLDLNESLDQQVSERTRDLREQQERRHAMMLNIFHDLRSPVFVIKGCLEVARSQAGGADRDGGQSPAGGTARLLDVALERVAFLSSLIEQLFLLARLESGEHEMPFERVDLGSLAQEVAQGQDVAAAQVQATVRTRIQPGCVVWGNPENLQRMIQNIVVNALHHTPAGAAVDVEVFARDGRCHLVVRDHGDGIRAHDLDKVFDRFYHTDKAGSSTGLGLAIAKNVAEAHRGHIAAHSEYGQGATFEVVLPLLE